MAVNCGEPPPDALVDFREDRVEITAPVLATSGKAHHPIVQSSENDSGRVPGTGFRISHDELLATESYEVPDYRRGGVKLQSGLQAWLYIKT